MVADDGSTGTTDTVVAGGRQGRTPARPRLAGGTRIPSRGNSQSRDPGARGAYCIFLDGDCIARPDFIAIHRRLAEPGWFVTGNRALLSPTLTRKVLNENLTPENWTFARWLAERWRGGINRLSVLVRLPLGPLRRVRQRAWRGARGCNLGIWRSDLERVDGFDAEYSAWGPEDSDLMVRLMHAGVRRKDGMFATGVLHLWHPPADRSRVQELDGKLFDLIDSDRIRAKRGLSALRAPTLPAMAAGDRINFPIVPNLTVCGFSISPMASPPPSRFRCLGRPRRPAFCWRSCCSPLSRRSSGRRPPRARHGGGHVAAAILCGAGSYGRSRPTAVPGP